MQDQTPFFRQISTKPRSYTIVTQRVDTMTGRFCTTFSRTHMVTSCASGICETSHQVAPFTEWSADVAGTAAC